METIITATVVDDRVAAIPTQSIFITGDKILVRVGSDFVAIPLRKQMPSYIEYGNQFFKLLEKDGVLKYEKAGRPPHGNATCVEAEEPKEKLRNKEEQNKIARAKDAIGTLVELLFSPK